MTKDEVPVFEAVAGDALANDGGAQVIGDPVTSKGEAWFRRFGRGPLLRFGVKVSAT